MITSGWMGKELFTSLLPVSTGNIRTIFIFGHDLADGAFEDAGAGVGDHRLRPSNQARQPLANPASKVLRKAVVRQYKFQCKGKPVCGKHPHCAKVPSQSTGRLNLSFHCEVPCGKLSTPTARTPAQVSAPASCACTPTGFRSCATPAPLTFVASDNPSLGARSSCRASRAPLRMSRSRRDRRP